MWDNGEQVVWEFQLASNCGQQTCLQILIVNNFFNGFFDMV